MIGIETLAGLESVPVIREVVLLLGDVGEEDFVPRAQRDAVVFVLLCDPAGCFNDLPGLLFISRLRVAQGGHLHVRPYSYMTALHVLDGVRAAVAHSYHFMHIR